jgi:acyl-CoA thioesterase I
MKQQLLMRIVVLMLSGLAVFSASAAKDPTTLTIVVLGDSLSAGYGLDAKTGWVSLLEQRLKSQAPPDRVRDADDWWNVINYSVSGETSAGGLAQLPEALERYRPALVLIELGGNDGLRGQSIDAMRANLEKMADLCKAVGSTPVFFEMRIPSNYGPAFTEKFHQTIVDVAQEKKAPLVPFFLGKIAEDRKTWFQRDGIHPNAAAQPMLLDAILPTIEPLIAKHVY